MYLQSGKSLQSGKYKIERVLGQGSFGVTYLATHGTLGKKLAIKEFFMKDVNSRDASGSITGMTKGSLSYNYAQKFKKEAFNLANLEHSNIVRVTDSFEENNTHYYVMDYIEGENLNDYLKTHRLTEKQSVAIVKEVASALIYMHEKHRMLHLDLKPGNIMRRASDGHIFLIDFGLSKHYSSDGKPETSTTVGLGTAGYAPIEQGNQEHSAEFRPTIDVYAFGATLYKLLTGNTPPTASDVMNDSNRLTDGLHRASISQHTIDIVVKAMQPLVKERYQSIRQFIEALATQPQNDEDTIVEAVLDEPTTTTPKEKNEEEPKPKEDSSGCVVCILVVSFIILVSILIHDTSKVVSAIEEAPATVKVVEAPAVSREIVPPQKKIVEAPAVSRVIDN